VKGKEQSGSQITGAAKGNIPGDVKIPKEKGITAVRALTQVKWSHKGTGVYAPTMRKYLELGIPRWEKKDRAGGEEGMKVALKDGLENVPEHRSAPAPKQFY